MLSFCSLFLNSLFITTFLLKTCQICGEEKKVISLLVPKVWFSYNERKCLRVDKTLSVAQLCFSCREIKSIRIILDLEMNWESRNFKQKSCLPYNSFFPHQRIQRGSISCQRCLRDQQEKKIKLNSELLSVASRARLCVMQTANKHVRSWLRGWQLWAAAGSTKAGRLLLSDSICIFSQGSLSATSQHLAPFSPDSTSSS